MRDAVVGRRRQDRNPTTRSRSVPAPRMNTASGIWGMGRGRDGNYGGINGTTRTFPVHPRSPLPGTRPGTRHRPYSKPSSGGRTLRCISNPNAKSMNLPPRPCVRRHVRRYARDGGKHTAVHVSEVKRRCWPLSSSLMALFQRSRSQWSDGFVEQVRRLEGGSKTQSRTGERHLRFVLRCCAWHCSFQTSTNCVLASLSYKNLRTRTMTSFL